MITIRLATTDEAVLAMRFIDEAREFQHEQGFTQWTNEYPNIDTINQDLREKKGYLYLSDGVPFGYACIDFSGERAYDIITGEWLTDLPYAVIHRLAFGKAGRGKGASINVFKLAKAVCEKRGVRSIRADTDNNNKCMKHILLREGFSYCGTVEFQGTQKLAYELNW